MTDLSSPERMSHAVLIAVLMHHSDSIDLPDDALDTDAWAPSTAPTTRSSSPGSTPAPYGCP